MRFFCNNKANVCLQSGQPVSHGLPLLSNAKNEWCRHLAIKLPTAHHSSLSLYLFCLTISRNCIISMKIDNNCYVFQSITKNRFFSASQCTFKFIFHFPYLLSHSLNRSLFMNMQILQFFKDLTSENGVSYTIHNC